MVRCFFRALAIDSWAFSFWIPSFVIPLALQVVVAGQTQFAWRCSTLHSPTYSGDSGGVRWSLACVTKCNKIVTKCDILSHTESTRVRWTPPDSGGLWWTLLESGGLHRTLVDSAGVWRTLVDSARLWQVSWKWSFTIYGYCRSLGSGAYHIWIL